MTLALPSNVSAYSEPSFLQTVTDSLLLPVDCKRLGDMGPCRRLSRALLVNFR